MEKVLLIFFDNGSMFKKIPEILHAYVKPNKNDRWLMVSSYQQT